MGALAWLTNLEFAAGAVEAVPDVEAPESTGGGGAPIRGRSHPLPPMQRVPVESTETPAETPAEVESRAPEEAKPTKTAIDLSESIKSLSDARTAQEQSEADARLAARAEAQAEQARLDAERQAQIHALEDQIALLRFLEAEQLRIAREDEAAMQFLLKTVHERRKALVMAYIRKRAGNG